MVNVCNDIKELKLIVRCVLVATVESLTIKELWKKTLNVLGGPHVVQLQVFGYDTVFDFLKSIPDVVQVHLILLEKFYLQNIINLKIL